MKKTILFIGASILLSACSQSTKYEIIDSTGNSHYTDMYNKTSDGCINFREVCQCESGTPVQVILCGSYIIKENQTDQP
jgi:major membrane immunogen (membrane-anchored lipoprotein)